jgi:hypothetical protein
MQQDPRNRIQNAGDLLTALGKAHQSLTSDTPEQVMRNLLETAPGQKVVVATRVLWPLRAAAVLAVVAAGSVGLAYLIPSLPDVGTAPERTVDTVTVMVEPEAPPPETVTVTLAAPRPSPRPVVSPSPGVAAAPAVAPVSKPKTALDIAAEKHGTSDVLELIKAEIRDGAFVSAAGLYDLMDESRKSTVEARLYYLRALRGAGRASQLRQALSAQELADGEYYLARAQAAHEQGRHGEALAHLDKSASLARVLMDYEQYKRESSYCRARCATAMFDAEPGEVTYKSAIDAWYEVRVALRSEPNHAYNKVMQQETQRIGQKRRELAGGAG